tara:strand:+ start:4334 stop:5920 length:1587 start_codon:yes stop_codon:yes gene_type:complete
MANKTTYEIQAKTRGFKDSKTQVKGLNNALGGLATKAMTVAGAYFGGRALLDGINASVDAFAQQELAEKKLEQALGRTSQALLDQASAMQTVTTFGDEAIIAQQAFLASIGMTEDQIKDILPVAADLASATGMTLESAVRNTAKTFSGLAGELGELVPQIRDLTAEEMKAGKAVEVMGELFQGVALTEAQTLQGTLSRVKNVMGDMAEDVGERLTPAIDSLAFAFLKLAGATSEEEIINREIDSLKERKRILESTTVSLLSLSVVEENNKRAVKEIDEEIIKLENDLRILRLDNSYLIIQDEERENLVALTEGEQALASLKEEALPKEIELNTLKNTQKAEEIDLTNRLIEVSRTKATMMKINSAMEVASNSQIAGSFAALNQAAGGSAKMTRNLTIAQAFADAYAGSVRAFRDYPAPASFAVSASVIASGLAAAYNAENAYQQHMDSKGAQYGFEGVVDEPTQFTVGEGGQAEYVSVTPMEGVDNSGVGTGITVNIQGNVMTDEFVEGELADRIADAVRRGTSFGMS